MRGAGIVTLSKSMTREEHQAIIAFVDRTLGGAQPPMDVEADAIIRALFVRNPDAAYRMTMLAMSLTAAAERPGPARRSRPGGWLAKFFTRREEVAARRAPVIS